MAADDERSFSSQNIHQDITHLMHLQHSNTPKRILRLPTVEEELFEELLSIRKPICICGRALNPIKKRYVGLYCPSYQNQHLHCFECNKSFMNTQLEAKRDDEQHALTRNDSEIIWLCPSKQIYPHLTGFFLCKTCCVEQMLSNQWTKQFSSTNRILNFILNELEKLEEQSVTDAMHEIHHRIPLQIPPPSPDTDTDADARTADIDDEQDTEQDTVADAQNDDDTTPSKQRVHKHKKTQSKVLSRMKTQSKIDLNLVYRGEKDILTIQGKEKYIALQLMNERQKELANIFAKVYDLQEYLTLLQHVCSHIVDFEFGYNGFLRQRTDEKNQNKNSVELQIAKEDPIDDEKTENHNAAQQDAEMTYFEHILKMTAWTEIRNKFHSRRIEWSLENIVWRHGLQRCLMKLCCCWCRRVKSWHDIEFTCCWAEIEFYFMGSIRLGYIALLFRYLYITLIVLIMYFWFADEYQHTSYHLYAYYVWIALAFLELLIINYLHHFVTMFKLNTVMKWGYKNFPKSVLTGLIIDDLLWFNAPPLIVLSDRNDSILHCAIGILRHLLMLHSFKLTVMIITGLLQIDSDAGSYNVILSFVLNVVIVVYFAVLIKYTWMPYGIYPNYKLIFLGLLSLTVINVFNLVHVSATWFFLICLLYAFVLMFGTTLAVASTALWFLATVACNYTFMNPSLAEERCIYWLLFLIIGFFMLEMETRRIARSLRWSDMKQMVSWTRGGCCVNCCLHCCCAGCSSE